MNSDDMTKSVRLLVVHDQDAYVDELRGVVELNDHLVRIECEYTDSAKEAIELIGSWHPSVILVDAHIEDMNSIGLLQQCQEVGTPIIVTSTYNSPEIGQAALRHGASAYCPASDDPESIDQVLQHVVLWASEASHLH